MIGETVRWLVHNTGDVLTASYKYAQQKLSDGWPGNLGGVQTVILQFVKVGEGQQMVGPTILDGGVQTVILQIFKVGEDRQMVGPITPEGS
jgi:hypothetical protein